MVVVAPRQDHLQLVFRKLWIELTQGTDKPYDHWQWV